MLNKIGLFVRLSRPLNLIIIFLSVIVAGAVCSGSNTIYFNSIIAGLSASFVAAAGYIINDYFDIEIDKINRPGRPLASGKIRVRPALVFCSFAAAAGLFLSLLINLSALIISFCALILLFLYSFRLKSKLFLGNFSIALLTALVFIYGGAAEGSISFAFIPALFAFLINLIREIVKDMQDTEGDLNSGIKTMPYKFGFAFAKNFMLIITILLILLTFYPFILKFYKIEYFIIVMSIVNPILVFFLVSIYKNDSPLNLNKLSFLLKLNMIFGLSAIYFGR
jgi:geranylgeranylglycerol-phosphate geranylgeranyltransferase